MLGVALVPFFVFREISHVLGPHKLAAMFFSNRNAFGVSQRLES